MSYGEKYRDRNLLKKRKYIEKWERQIFFGLNLSLSQLDGKNT